MSTQQWYYAVGQDRRGPITADELKAMFTSGQLGLSTLVWSAGMPQWLAATMIAEFNPQGVAMPTLPEQGDATGGVIPYKNLPALLAYYAGVFSILPFFPIGLCAIGLGIAGLRKRKREPWVRGAVHAWIGIVLGTVFGLLWGALTVLAIVGMVTNA